jgi:hypothetical protein
VDSSSRGGGGGGGLFRLRSGLLKGKCYLLGFLLLMSSSVFMPIICGVFILGAAILLDAVKYGFYTTS